MAGFAGQPVKLVSVFDSILFDFDGVLADTEPIHFACWSEVLIPLGIELPWDYYQRECIGVSDRAMLERLGAARQPPISADEIWPSYSLKKGLFHARMAAHPPFLQATLDLVHELAHSYKLAVVSSSHRSEVEPPLRHAGIRECFQAIVCGMEVPNLKPAPDPYLRAAEMLGSRSPLVIEDSDAGVASATAAGFEVLRLTRPDALSRELRRLLQ
jgi:HAD superfamily hydrolase (TIGR01509 family)